MAKYVSGLLALMVGLAASAANAATIPVDINGADWIKVTFRGLDQVQGLTSVLW